MPASPPFRRAFVAATVVASCALAWSAPASADHAQPARNIANLPYQPIGEFAHGTDIPEPDEAEAFFAPKMNGRRYDGPTGTYNAFDTNVFETLMLPFRAAGDTTTNDPYGNGGDPRHGFCALATPAQQQAQRPGNILLAAGICPNHALEYAAYYEDTMQDILGKFGVKMHRYEFEVPPPALGSAPPDNTLGGKAYNLAAVIPGADHPDETVIIGAHYDQTNDGPASTWDSAEGHAQIIRVAKQMADYWTATGTRPSATIKFIPWAGEEAGTLGSLDYAENNIVPGEEGEVRGYWNTDPCAGGYPAYRYGNPAQRIPLGIQLARPTEVPDEFGKLRPRVTEFNNKAQQVVEDFFNARDDTVKIGPADHPRPIYVSTAEAASEGSGTSDVNTEQGVKLGSSRPVLFSSDWANFLAKGVPFFNPGPEVTGPSDENEANYPDGAATFHTPRDNQVTMNQFTGQPQSGLVANDAVASEGWAKGMEMCASLLSWGMLRSDQAGAQTTQNDVVAYYEALPNEAIARGPVTFDAGGSYQYLDKNARTFVPDSQLEYKWEFGDGTTATGKVVEHSYDVAGTYTSKLTVTGPGGTDTMSVPITVVGASEKGPELTAPAEDEDGKFDVNWKFDEKAGPGFKRYVLEEATDVRRAFTDPAENLGAGWTASDPTEPALQKWQHSDEASDSLGGNQKHSGQRSFWTGVNSSDQRPRTGPSSGVSVLTLKNGFQIGKDAELSYWSSFLMDANDTGRVEAAIDDGSPADELDWEVVDRLTSVESYRAGDTEYPEALQQRRIDLGKFSNQKIKLRFVLSLGTSQYVNVFRSGWYVDDMSIDTGTFRTIGEPTAPKFSVGPRSKGTYTYRVRGVFADTATLTSNFGSTRVTVGTDPAAGGTGGGPGGIPAATPRCSVDNGFRSVRVRRRGRGLRFEFSKSVAGKVRVDVFRYVRGRKITRKTVARFRNRTKSFTWNGRGKRVRNGSYYARIEVPTAGKPDVRYFALVRSRGRFKLRSAFVARATCGPLRQFRLGQLVFGGKRREGLRVVYEVADAGTVRIEVLRGKRVVRRTSRRIARPGPYSTTFSSKRLRKGKYRVRIIAEVGGRRVVSTLTAYRV